MITNATTQSDLRRRITYLMVLRLVLITLVLALSLLANMGSPDELTQPYAVALFSIIAATYALALVYAVLLPRTSNALRLYDIQVAGDLLVTSAMVHVTGGLLSPLIFFFPLTILGTALVRYRRGVTLVAAAAAALFVVIALGGWLQILPSPPGLAIKPWGLEEWDFVRKLLLNVGAFAAIAALASVLAAQLDLSGKRLESEVVRTADLTAVNESIIRCLSGGLITIDEKENVLVFNDWAETILGTPREDVLGRPLEKIVPTMHALLDKLTRAASMRREELTTATASGREVPLGVSASYLTDHLGKRTGTIFHFQDLSELRAMEEQVGKARRLAILGRIATGVAHEIRNPLASISGSIELLRTSSDWDEENQSLVDIVLREVERLDALIADLLMYARPPKRVPATFDLRNMVQETVRVFEHDKERAAIDVEFASNSEQAVLIEADPAQVRQVVWNLLRNAAQAMPDGGNILVSIRTQMTERGAFAELSVQDSGPGISEEDVAHIFELFFSTKSGGSGLGLATVHRIVTEHGGSITVTSPAGQGAHFSMKLPAIA